jgi:hypothetical protein
MATGSRTLSHAVVQRPAVLAATIAVGGALAMTNVLAAAALLASALAGVPARQAPALLTADAAFPRFCAAAGLFTALLAGYIMSRFEHGASPRQTCRACVLTLAGHVAIVMLLGSPLAPWATAVYIAGTLPALCLGCYLGAPVLRYATNANRSETGE